LFVRIASLPMAARFGCALLVGLAAGYFCALAHFPLPWLIGPLLACASCNVAGAGLVAPVVSRNAGQWVIGTALGLYFTAETLAHLARFGWPLLLGMVYAVALGALFGWALHRFGGIDPATAFFAGAIGGASEMALQGERNGAAVETIAAVHTIRVMLVVLTIPFIYQLLQLHGHDRYIPGIVVVDYRGMVWLVAATCAGAVLLKALNSPNAWMIGPLLVTIGLTATGHIPTALPAWLVNAGQLLIGIALGTRFAPGFFSRAPRVVAVVGASTVLGIAASAGFGYLLAASAGIAPATMILATSPGGVAEMSLTAKQLQLGVPIVTSFHILRLLLMVLAAGGLYRVIARRRGWPIDVHRAKLERADEDD
jgi:uncharacterized protein